MTSETSAREIWLAGETPRRIGSLLWNANSERITTAAFRYDAAWLKCGFSLGSDLPLTDKTFSVNLTPGPAGGDNPPFLFIRDLHPGSWIRDLTAAAHLNGLKLPQSASALTEDHLWAFSGHENDRFSGLRLPLTGSIQRNFTGDPFEKKTLQKILTLLDDLKHDARRFKTPDLQLALDLCTDIGGNSPKALIKAAGKTNGGWVMRPADTSEGFNTARWHAVTMELARQCGLKTLAFQYLPGPLNGAYLEERFDRSHNGTPLMALSAATLVTPRVNIRTGKPVLPTYLDIADILNRDGADTKTDLRELFARLLFNTLTGNGRDKLTDFFFIRAPYGWRLAPLSAPLVKPAFMSVRLLQTPIRGTDPVADPETAVSVARYFGVPTGDAKELRLTFQKILSSWSHTARGLGATNAELELMERSFA